MEQSEDPVSDATLVGASTLFDHDWYAQQYDVADGDACDACDAPKLDPIDHYLRIGAALGHDPSPAFSTRRYLTHHPDVAIAGMNPLVHYLRHGMAEGRTVSLASTTSTDAPLPASRRGGRPCILVVGHIAGEHLFGAERSLLDLLDAFNCIDMSTVVVVPTTTNTAYIDQLAARSSALHMMPVPMRSVTAEPDEVAIARFGDLIDHYGIDAVHTNTIVPHEPLLAARRRGLPAVVHAREIPYDDPALCEWLDADPDALVASVLAAADHVIANSLATARSYPLMGATSVVPNIVDVDRFPILGARHGPVRVALVGSGHEKKGRREFFELARRLARRDDCELVMVGPSTEQASQWQSEGVVPANVAFAGYVDGPVAAMRGLDIVVHLSNCRDAFPRVVLEAMASGLPIVAWNRGGVAEQVIDGSTGYLVPFGDLDRFTDCVETLVADRAKRVTMGLAGRQRVEEHFSPKVMAAALAGSYRAILRTPAVRAQMTEDIVVPIPTENRSQHAEPFYVGNRARFAYISGVRWLSPTRLAAASLLGQRLYLIELDLPGRAGEIVAAVPTTDGTREVIVDLLAVDEARVFTSNCEHSSVSEYRVEGDRVTFVACHSLPDARGGYCHGVSLVPLQPHLVAATITTAAPGVHFRRIAPGPQPASFCQEGWRPSNLAFRSAEVLAVVADHNTVSQSPFHRHTTKVTLLEFRLDGEAHVVLDELTLEPGARVDSCVFHGDTLFIANQAHDSVMTFDTAGDRLRHLADLEGFSFPHDMGVSPDGTWMAVANYGTNEIRVRRLRSATSPAN